MGLRNYQDLIHVKTRMQELQKKTIQPLKGDGDTHRTYSTRF